MNKRINKIKDATIRRPYVFYFIGIFFLYLGINILVNKSFVVLPNFFNLYKPSFAISFLFLNLITALLVAINLNLVILKFKELKLLSKIGSTTSMGVFGGILGGACPGCFVGLFPAFVGLFGLTATLSSLPLHGLEIQIASSALLVLSIFLLTNETVCKVKIKK